MTAPLDPAAVVAEFIDRVAPYDPASDLAPVAAVGIRTALGEATFAMSDHVIRAMCRALASYRDPVRWPVLCGRRTWYTISGSGPETSSGERHD